jgi:hypothetical protein
MLADDTTKTQRNTVRHSREITDPTTKLKNSLLPFANPFDRDFRI